MYNKRLKTINDICRWRLCVGCGACVSMCKNSALKMVDFTDRGLRPVADLTKCEQCGECLNVCPGFSIENKPHTSDCNYIPELRRSWGDVIEVFEAYAADDEIRYKGSSGGVATALGLFCLENMKFSGALQIRADSSSPWKNIPAYSKNKADMLLCTGSRYSPASLCSEIKRIKNEKNKSVFIGKACDIAALRKFQNIDPELKEKAGIAISIFCAGTPSTKGTDNLLKKLGVEPARLLELRYRGEGWPGMASAKVINNPEEKYQMTYREAWDNILTPCVQFSCRICPDHTGEQADISCGDPWYREIEKNDPGRSLVLIRTETGREIFHAAHKTGYIKTSKGDPSIVGASQISILQNRRHLYGRLLAMNIMGLPVPVYSGFNLKENFRDISISEKIKSIAGTAKRIITRGMLFPDKLQRITLKNKIISTL